MIKTITIVIDYITSVNKTHTSHANQDNP